MVANMVHSPEQDSSIAPRRCVVLAVKKASLPTALLAGLSQRQVTTVLVYDPASAMLQLAEAATTSLIIVQPQRQPRLAELAAAVGRYFPKTRIWQYGVSAGASEPTLSKLELPSRCQCEPHANASDDRRVVVLAHDPKNDENGKHGDNEHLNIQDNEDLAKRPGQRREIHAHKAHGKK